MTLFPAMFAGPFAEGMVRKAIRCGACDLRLHDLRDFGEGVHRSVDDYGFGGGPGMVLKPGPAVAACEALRAEGAGPVLLMSPQGRRLDQSLCRCLARHSGLTLLCGRYEGVDERVRLALGALEVSIGDYVLTGGELAAMVLVDAVVRLLPGVLASGSAENDSFSDGLLEGPQYTRPRKFRDWLVPDVLLSGDHRQIMAWRRREALRRTWRRRPELLAQASLSERDGHVLAEIVAEDVAGQGPECPEAETPQTAECGGASGPGAVEHLWEARPGSQGR